MRRLEAWRLGSGLALAGALVGLVGIDVLTPLDPLGRWNLVPAAAFGLLIGAAAGVLFHGTLEPAEHRGGGRALGGALVALIVAALLIEPVLPPDGAWPPLTQGIFHRLRWTPLFAVPALVGVLPGLRRADGETLHDARLRRALGYWLSAWGAPLTAAALVALHAAPGFALLAVLVPVAPVLAALGVRVPEAALHGRGMRLRFAALSWLCTASALSLATAREMLA